MKLTTLQHQQQPARPKNKNVGFSVPTEFVGLSVMTSLGAFIIESKTVGCRFVGSLLLVPR